MDGINQVLDLFRWIFVHLLHAVVNFFDALLREYLHDQIFLLLSELLLGKIDVERDIKIAFDVDILVFGHAFALLLDYGARPCDLFACNLDFMLVQVLELEFKAV